jgi:hypothetical protein
MIHTFESPRSHTMNFHNTMHVLTSEFIYEARMKFIMKNIVFWDVAPHGSCLNWRFGGTYRLHLQGRWWSEESAVTCLTVISCFFTCPEDGGDMFRAGGGQRSLQSPAYLWSHVFSPALKMEAIRSSEVSVQTRATWCYIPEDDIPHSHRRENLRLYKFIMVCWIISWLDKSLFSQ